MGLNKRSLSGVAPKGKKKAGRQRRVGKLFKKGEEASETELQALSAAESLGGTANDDATMVDDGQHGCGPVFGVPTSRLPGSKLP